MKQAKKDTIRKFFRDFAENCRVDPNLVDEKFNRELDALLESEPKLKEYKVRWSIQIQAESQIDAAITARKVQLDDCFVDTFFEVKEAGDENWTGVDIATEVPNA